MNQINTITDAPSQTMVLRLDNGQSLTFSLFYSYNQSGWFYSFTLGSETVNNRRLVTSLNLLRGIRNIIPFGLMCKTTDNHDPVFIDDFLNGRAILYTLTSDEVEYAESLLGNT